MSVFKLSLEPFSQRRPGSICAVWIRNSAGHLLNIPEVNSWPLSERMCSGVPALNNKSEGNSGTSREVSRPPTRTRGCVLPSPSGSEAHRHRAVGQTQCHEPTHDCDGAAATARWSHHAIANHLAPCVSRAPAIQTRARSAPSPCGSPSGPRRRSANIRRYPRRLCAGSTISMSPRAEQPHHSHVSGCGEPETGGRPGRGTRGTPTYQVPEAPERDPQPGA